MYVPVCCLRWRATSGPRSAPTATGWASETQPTTGHRLSTERALGKATYRLYRLPVPDRVPAALAELQVQAAHGLIADAFLHAAVAACYLFLTACYGLLLPATARYTSTGIGNGTAGPVQQQAG